MVQCSCVGDKDQQPASQTDKKFQFLMDSRVYRKDRLGRARLLKQTGGSGHVGQFFPGRCEHVFTHSA